jgi:hypothetical protein
MSVNEIIRRARADGLTLTLVEGGDVRVGGARGARARWIPAIRAEKDIVALLLQWERDRGRRVPVTVVLDQGATTTGQDRPETRESDSSATDVSMSTAPEVVAPALNLSVPDVPVQHLATEHADAPDRALSEQNALTKEMGADRVAQEPPEIEDDAGEDEGLRLLENPGVAAEVARRAEEYSRTAELTEARRDGAYSNNEIDTVAQDREEAGSPSRSSIPSPRPRWQVT